MLGANVNMYCFKIHWLCLVNKERNMHTYIYKRKRRVCHHNPKTKISLSSENKTITETKELN